MKGKHGALWNWIMKIVYENVSDRLQTILSRLKGVKKVGENTYRAYSPLRDEKEPSLYITEQPDGIIPESESDCVYSWN